MTTLWSQVLVSVLLFSSAASGANDPNYCDSKGKCTSHYVAHSFARFQDLPPAQSAILLRTGISDSEFTPEGATVYEKWTAEHDEQAANYLAVTRTLAHLEVQWPDGRKAWAIDFVIRINRFAGDRIYAQLDREAFESWVSSGGAFKLYRADGKHETGKMKFYAGTVIGSSLHKGYDVQGFTSKSKMPRVQINYRFKDAEADIDLDGYAPLIWGFIPNPVHATYKNSDPRQWYDLLLRKVGDPGFRVRPH